MIIETERLIIRRHTLDDAEGVFKVNSDPEVSRYTGEAGVKSKEEASVLIEKNILSDYENYGFGRMAVIYKPDNEFIGFTGLKYLPELDTVDIGYRFAKKYWGIGIATESALPFIKYGFETLKLKEIIGLVIPENTASSNVLEKLGLEFQKTFEYFGDMVEKYAIYPRNE